MPITKRLVALTLIALLTTASTAAAQNNDHVSHRGFESDLRSDRWWQAAFYGLGVGGLALGGLHLRDYKASKRCDEQQTCVRYETEDVVSTVTAFLIAGLGFTGGIAFTVMARESIRAHDAHHQQQLSLAPSISNTHAGMGARITW